MSFDGWIGEWKVSGVDPYRPRDYQQTTYAWLLRQQFGLSVPRYKIVIVWREHDRQSRLAIVRAHRSLRLRDVWLAAREAFLASVHRELETTRSVPESIGIIKTVTV